MKDLKNRLFLVFLVIYIALFTVFLGKTLLEVIKRPIPAGQSSIPSLLVSQLDKVSTKLEQREKLSYPEKIDLSKIEFGKLEPFNP